MKNTVRTIYGIALQDAQLLGIPYEHVPNTTLNEKFDIFPLLRPDNNAVPRARYYAIGIGGRRPQTGADSRVYIAPIQHRPEDAAPYEHVPFLLREANDDIDIETRRKYALRKQITVRGQNYIAYYLKRLDMDEVRTTMKINSTIDGTETSTPFVPTAANLNPTPPEISNTGVVTTTGQYLSASAMVNLDFSAQDTAELINAITIIYENPLLAVISEIAIVAGEDKVVTVAVQGAGNINYTEVVSAIVVAHMTADYAVGFINRGFDFDLELGATEPLIGVADSTP